MGTSTAKPNKYVAMITYCVALVCLLLGLFLPFCNAEAELVDAMTVSQLPAAIDALFTTELAKGEGFFHSALTYSFPVQFFGLGKGIDLGAILVLLYTLFTVAALIGLIPVIASKKESAAALKTASVIEILALIPLSALVFIEFASLKSYDGFVWSYSLLAAFGGTLLMLIIQSFAYKKGSGAVKFVLLLLSALAILFAVLPVTVIVPALGDVLGKTEIGTGVIGNDALYNYLVPVFQYNDFIGHFNGNTTEMLLNIAAIAALILVLLNAILDMMGLGKTTNKPLLVCNVVRFALEVVAVVVMVIMSFVVENVSSGLMLWVLTGIAVVQLLINIIRLCTFKRAKKTAKAEKPAKEKPAKPEKVEKAKEEAPAKTAEKETAVAAAEAAKPASKAESDPLVYNVGPIYNGPTDDFIKKLTNDEKIEFARIFLERKSGNLPTIPNYEVGGNNGKFFASIFIYYGRIRGLVSDGLMNKFYEQGNMMD